MNEPYIPALIFSRCIESVDERYPEFGSIQKESTLSKENLNLLRGDTHFQRDMYGKSVFSFDRKIVWIDGSRFYRVESENQFANLINYSNQTAGPDREELSKFQDLMGALFKEILDKTSIHVKDELILMIHVGGQDVTDEHYNRLLAVLNRVFEGLKIKLIFRLITSMPRPDRTAQSAKTDPVVHRSLVGLDREEGLHIEEVRKFLDSLRSEVKPDMHTELEAKVKEYLFSDTPAAFTELRSYINSPDIRLPDLCKPELVDMLKVDDGSAGTNRTGYKLYTTETVTEAGRRRVIFKDLTPANKVLAILIRKLAAGYQIPDTCAFIYLGSDVLSNDNFNAAYDFEPLYEKSGVECCVFITMYDLVGIANGEYEKGGQHVMPAQGFISSVDARFRFFDSTVWFRILPLLAGKARINSILLDLQKFYSKNIYKIHQAIEYRQFLIRIFNQSYIDIKNDFFSHGKRISPMFFHAESFMKKKLQSLLSENLCLFSRIKWSMHLVDDHSDKQLQGSEMTKKELIAYLLDSFIRDDAFMQPEAARLNSQISITETASTVEAAKKNLLRNKLPTDSPDVILLDYLLVGDAAIEYGDQLIGDVVNSKEGEYSLGPLHKCWFFPISVYANMIQNKLHERGISPYSEKCMIVAGADPINTPYLFLYNLFTMFKYQVVETVKVPLQYVAAGKDVNKVSRTAEKTEVLADHEAADGLPSRSSAQPGLVKVSSGHDAAGGFQNPLISYLDTIRNERGDYRSKAIEIFPRLVELAATYSNMLNYRSNSRFSESIREHIFSGLEASEVEQFRDVIYLFAFAGVKDKDKLWGEWSIMKDILLGKIGKDTDDRKTVYNKIYELELIISSIQ